MKILVCFVNEKQRSATLRFPTNHTLYSAYPLIKYTKNIEISGINVISNRQTTMEIRNGIAAFAIFSYRIFATADATNKLAPYGGVTKPIASATVIKIPK